jgi:hypothetical protein
MKILGYFFAIAGLVILILNAYWYITGEGIQTISLVSSILLCLLGAVMIRLRQKKLRR